MKFTGRVLETFFGNCIEGIDPNAIYQTIWGSDITKGDGLKNVPIVVQICAYILKKLGERLYMNSFTAKHDGTVFDKTAAFFNGFKTIIDNDIAGTNENKEVYIAEHLATSSTSLIPSIRSMPRMRSRISTGDRKSVRSFAVCLT